MLLQNVNTTTCSVSSTAQEINQANETASVNMKGCRQTIDVNFNQSDFLKFIGSIMCDFFKGKRGRRKKISVFVKIYNKTTQSKLGEFIAYFST